MANLNEEAKWESGIFQIETTTPALGGADGPVNTAPRQLANRTQYLKAKSDSFEATLDSAKGTAESIDARFKSVEKTTAQADFTFSSTSGTTITHNIGNTDYHVSAEPVEATNGELGEVYIVKNANNFNIYNTGAFTGSGRYQITR